MRGTIALILLLAPLIALGIVLVFVPPDPPWFVPYRDGVLAVLMIIWMMLSIPFGIMVAIDWLRSPRPTGRLASILRHLLRVPIFLLGVTAVFIGISVLASVAYNLLWQRQAEFRSAGSIAMFLVMIGFGASLISLALGRDRPGLEDHSVSTRSDSSERVA
jgi:hypothetical protein